MWPVDLRCGETVAVVWVDTLDWDKATGVLRKIREVWKGFRVVE